MVELEIPPRSAYVGVVRLALASLARSIGVDEEVLDDLKIAVSEACANAVLSNEEAGTDAPVTVHWHESEGRVTVEVGDRGSIYESAPSGEDSQGFSPRLVMSLGLLEALVEECTFEPRPGGGMLTRLSITA
ncbi:MAG: ATP-binding protein [Actinomycetota bacterium]|nr:ATP-binding protein [Actinomycetota bacterium]